MKKVSGHNGLNQLHSDAKEQLVDVVLIGGGVMSATLGTFLQQLEPNWTIEMFERLGDVAQESSYGWNNAGTGHSALAEMNYTPEKSDGQIDISKAIKIYEQFQLSRQFWAYLVKHGLIKNPSSFINSVPHMSFVWGEDNVRYLRKRFQAMHRSPLFDGMAYSEDADQIKSWIPLVMNGRDKNQPIAATRTRLGTDVNFGALTQQLVKQLTNNDHFSLHTNHQVTDIKRHPQGGWSVSVQDTKANTPIRQVRAKYVFIGAGGASLRLLQKSGIPEARAYAGFPVGGQFLVTENQELVEEHLAKVYGKASVGAPPMSVPHLDTRVIDGKRLLLFGPFASFSSKFLKEGSLWDLFGSLTPANVLPMAKVGVTNFNLVTYLIGQLRQTDNDRFAALQTFFPQAKQQDWRLWQAGQRVQIIKNVPGKGGQLQLGTELVNAQDGSLTAMLGASPGASTSAAIMLELLESCFAQEMASPEWQAKIKAMVPSYGESLHDQPELNQKILLETSKVLGLEHHLDDWSEEPVATEQTSDEEQYESLN
ncbi:malate dehydrogenase (quinone) [Vibrio porteresiae]|uniref:Probable malate:quinone oxidoreductase n=1 Tax=Vibrio porteresiae DSM 19223 TaxID=1123496 RepID=A0ABZ0QF21_9VIBR|nr:malate dehydrogenase (quinone) [Vibrio porteresiae]WPC75074.1 malate dehydrogenase (quinone) [Vibrio porteresiae DSM 19223]